MELERRKFQGVLNILSFNRHFYVFGLSALLLIILIKVYFSISDFAFWTIVIAFLYGLIMPLIVSAYVYDFSDYYSLRWLNQFNLKDKENQKIININAGFDETSFLIKEEFPQSDLAVLDFYNPETHTEAAIVRARKVSLVYPNTSQISTNYIPHQDNSADLIFMLSAVHEIRSNDEKVLFLKECHRICKPGGKVIMVEHLRDTANFLAFSIGFTHFFSRKVWEKSFKKAGFSSFKEFKFTPFMSIFITTP